jgi:Zn-finger nucleic acid-binding protein
LNCPIDGTELRISERQGIEIDYCPKCRGIWLDRGELDKLLERSAQLSTAESTARATSERDPGRDRERDRDYDRDRDRDRGRHDDDDRRPSDHDRGKRRRSFLDDLFDFD